MSNPYEQLYKDSLALLTDFYQLTMSYGYWKKGFDQKEAVFHLFFRKRPFNGGFTIAAGLETVVHYLQNFRFKECDLNFLATIEDGSGKPLFESQFLDYLADLKFTCDVDAVVEGTVVFPFEPLVRIQGPLIQCQLLESPLLNLINFPSLIATKAARMRVAAQDDKILEFGLRRAQGVDGALTASRAAFIGGCDATSNVLAGKLYGIPVKGTHSHSWVMAFDEELNAFQAFAESIPSATVFLVDTYDTLEGVKKAIQVGKWLKENGKTFHGIRLDSGDLAWLSQQARHMLDEAGFVDAQIYASNALDEILISELKRQDAKITVWGVGTSLVTSQDQPSLDGVYKLSAIRDSGQPWTYKLKLSEQMSKVSNPGILQVTRFYAGEENIADVLHDTQTDLSEGCKIINPLDPTHHKILGKATKRKQLLVPIFKKGELVYELPTLKAIQANTYAQLQSFHAGIKRFFNPHLYPVGMEESLYNLKVDLIKKIRHESTTTR